MRRRSPRRRSSSRRTTGSIRRDGSRAAARYARQACESSPGMSTRCARGCRGCWSCSRSTRRTSSACRRPSARRRRSRSTSWRRRGTAPSITRAAGGPGSRCWRRAPLTLGERASGCPASRSRARRAGARRPSTGSASPASTSPTAARWTAPSTRASSPSWTRWRGWRHARRPAAVVAGDMNIAPADLDVYDPAAFAGGTHVSAPERERLAAILGTGLVDAYRHLHPTSSSSRGGTTAPATSTRGSGCGSTWRCVSRELAPRLAACGIDRDFRKGTKPSDHAPLLVDLARAPTIRPPSPAPSSATFTRTRRSFRAMARDAGGR